MLVDLRPKRLTGKSRSKASSAPRITCNKNGVPFDPEKPTVTSGVRLGTPAATTRGFGVAEFKEVGEMIADVLDGLASKANEQRAVGAEQVRGASRIHASDFRSIPSRGASADGKREAREREETTAKRGCAMRCPLLRQSRHPGQGFATDRRQRRHPSPACLPGLRRPLHDVRARAIA